MTPSPLTHADPSRSDDRLVADAAAHLGRHPGLQLVTELLTRLREMEFPWWTSEQLREAYPADVRLTWFAERPDLRQRITTQLTGLAPRAARNKTPGFQAALVDSVIDEGDITVGVFETAFEPSDMASYGPAADFFRLFRQRMPWDDDATPHQDLVGWLIGALLSDRSMLDGTARTPILTAVQVRTAIDGRVWHSRIPLHVRVAIDDARFAAERESPMEPYGVERDLAIATPALIAASIPLRDLLGVIDVAAAELGFDEPSAPQRAQSREATTKPASTRADTEEGGPRATPKKERPAASSSFAARIRQAAIEAAMPQATERTTAPASDAAPSPATERPTGAVSEVIAAPPVTQPPGEAAIEGAPEVAIVFDEESLPDVGVEDPETESVARLNLDAGDPPEIVLGEVNVSEEPARDAGPDEMEHTNPWIVPSLAGELAQNSPRDRNKKKGDR